MRNRFENAKNNLIDLLRAYGHRAITVKIDRNGEELKILASSFVKRQMTTTGIFFPFNEKNKKNTKIINTTLDDDDLSILFHRAVFEFEEAYIEEFCLGRPEAEGFVNSIYSWIDRKDEWLKCTFSNYDEPLEPFLKSLPKPKHEKGDLSVGLNVAEEDVKALRKMGFRQISSVKSMTQVLWAFATYRIPITHSMHDAILFITVDEDAVDYLNSHVRNYNTFIQERIEDAAFPGEKESRKLQEEIKELNKKHQTELQERSRNHKMEVKELNKKHLEELQAKVQNYKEKLKGYEAITKRFRRFIQLPNGKVSQIFDLTKEYDIDFFISWYRIVHKKVKNQTVKYIMAERFADNPSEAELFLKKVDEYNSSLNSCDDEVE